MSASKFYRCPHCKKKMQHSGGNMYICGRSPSVCKYSLKVHMREKLPSEEEE